MHPPLLIMLRNLVCCYYLMGSHLVCSNQICSSLVPLHVQISSLPSLHHTHTHTEVYFRVPFHSSEVSYLSLTHSKSWRRQWWRISTQGRWFHWVLRRNASPRGGAWVLYPSTSSDEQRNLLAGNTLALAPPIPNTHLNLLMVSTGSLV